LFHIIRLGFPVILKKLPVKLWKALQKLDSGIEFDMALSCLEQIVTSVYPAVITFVGK
jgi:hypothetical protein